MIVLGSAVGDFLVPSSTTGIEVLSVLVSDLATVTTPTVLPAFNESSVPICSDDSVIETSLIDVANGILSVFTRIISKSSINKCK